jgi:hypothetical protein
MYLLPNLILQYKNKTGRMYTSLPAQDELQPEWPELSLV